VIAFHAPKRGDSKRESPFFSFKSMIFQLGTGVAEASQKENYEN
jgi:hypothetical protein